LLGQGKTSLLCFLRDLLFSFFDRPDVAFAELFLLEQEVTSSYSILWSL